MRILLWLAVALAFPAAVEAAPQVKPPACDGLLLWAALVNNSDNFNPAPRVVLPKAFRDVVAVPVFGTSAETWSFEDVQAVSQALVACYLDAGKRHDQVAAAALGNANRTVTGILPRANDAMRKAKNEADTIQKQLESQPPSAELARAIGLLVKANPATPDMGVIRGLPREISDPLWHLMQVELTLGDADREALWKVLDDRRRDMEARLDEEAKKQVDATMPDANGVITLMQLRQRIAGMTDSDEKSNLLDAADGKARDARQVLRQVKPPVWVPPSCLELYRLSSAPNAGGMAALGRRGVVIAFTDERTIPVFGLSVGDWTDDDLARFKELRGICHAATQIQPGLAVAVNLDALELTQLANRGRWIDGADQQIADARATIRDYHRARQDLTALREKMQALPDNASSMGTLADFISDPLLTSVTQEDRTAFTNAVLEKRSAIGASIADSAVKGLAGIKVATTADLPKLFAYAGQMLPTIPDAHAQQVFAMAFNLNLDDITKRLLPDFKRWLSEAPVDVAGLVRVKEAEDALGDGGKVVAFRPFHEAALERHDVIVQTVHGHACAFLLSKLNVGDDASQDLWDGDKGIKLGDFICGLAEHGVMVSGYSGAGLFSSTSTLKLTPLLVINEIVSLRKAEVRPGHSMLVGYKIVDANGRPIIDSGTTGDAKGDAAASTLGWEVYAKQAKGDGPNVTEGCKTIMAAPPSALGPGETLFWLHCAGLPAATQIAAAPR